VSTVSPPRARARGRRLPGRPRRVDPSLARALVPVAVSAAIGWDLRWVNEDGFIYLRVVDHLLAGDGPVFNAGERVEAYTSPAWLAVLTLGGALVRPAGLEFLSVLLGLALSVGGLLAACLGAIALWRELAPDERRPFAPLGAVVVAAVPAFWGFETSGLETGLVFAWLGGAFLGLARLVADGRPGTGGHGGPHTRRVDAARRRPLLLAALIGIGPLVRPDLASFAFCFLAVLLLLVRPLRRRTAVGLVVAAVALPLAYQVFRMGYFASPVPSTALAKEAGLPFWSRGLNYLGNLVLPYALPIPLAVLAGLGAGTAAPAWRAGRRGAVLVGAAAVAGALLHTLYVVRLGGDYMHGRMLLPSLFGLLMPVAVVALPGRRLLAGALAGTVVAWALVCALTLRTPSQFGPEAGRWQVLDQRSKQPSTPSHPHPVTLADHDVLPFPQPSVGRAARSLARPGGAVLSLDARVGRRRTADGSVPVQVPRPLDVRAAASVRAPVVIFTGSIGRLGVAAGREVWIADRLGLADPVAARLRLAPGRTARAGHEKLLPAAWFLARFADPASVAAHPRFAANPRIPAARAALGCGGLRRLMEAVSAPLTLDRFLSNVGASLELGALRIPADPVAARRELCRPRPRPASG
jgi:arabinofuranosyltransferase